MILADKIIYLRKQAGFSQEELASQINVSRQSVSKWEGAQSIPDMDKILILSNLFGVSTDFLLKDEIEELDGHSIVESSLDVRKVSLEEANKYIEINQDLAPKLALGVFMCIVSPIVLILLTSLRPMDMSENFASAVGLTVLLLLVASAVALFVYIGSQTKDYQFLEKEDFELQYGVESILNEKQNSKSSKNLLHVIMGIVLIIISIIPLLFSIDRNSETIGVSITIFIVAIGVFNIIYGYMRNAIYSKILKKGDYTPANKKKERTNEIIGSIYWPIVVLLYLSYSFITGDWGRSWIIWPIAGILFGIISVTASLFFDKD